ncbi:hypothetical protein [Laspinema olomoucense]|uniref:Uncharacterized protein n=1 Tax=Laspinema olomoucense D3b TaxID=2953688 RepID=A0ABT2NFT0_9CYAN|nr:hypothetical protein [Laspinema sp. D3b]MCT7981568.1 hypothetical protein [Laspinema sp. D3b]
MIFVFSEVIQAGIDSGLYEVVKDKAGVALGIARDKITGQFVGHAIAAVAEPFLVPVEIGLEIAQIAVELGVGAAQMIQTHCGFQKTYKMLNQVLTTVAVLQGSTALIGVGIGAVAVLSAINLQQTLKWREDVKQLRLEVKDGFIDLKQALHGQGEEIMYRIDRMSEDIEFKHHRTILAESYGKFREAVKCLNHALKLTSVDQRNDDFNMAKGMLFNALANYNNPDLYHQTSAAGQLRRMECSWLIDQTITTIYQLQGAHEVVSARLFDLRKKIRDSSLQIIDRCECDNELDFLFPEVTRIHTQDLPLLESWQNQVDWIKDRSPSELQELARLELPAEESSAASENTNPAEPPVELSLYKTLKQKSHYDSLRDQLRFIVKPELRQHHESYVFQRANATGYNALAPSNWQEVPDLTVANLYHYFKQQEQYA